MSPAELIDQARIARERAYAPYSHFNVGAAVITRDGRIFLGCNIENAAYGQCNCAERTALFSGVADGCRPGDFLHLAVIADTDTPVSPCGACRQVMAELGGGDMKVTLANTDGDSRETTAGELLPEAFQMRNGIAVRSPDGSVTS